DVMESGFECVRTPLVFRSFWVLGLCWGWVRGCCGGVKGEASAVLSIRLTRRRSADASGSDPTGLLGRAAADAPPGVHRAVVPHVLRAGGGAGRAGQAADGVRDAGRGASGLVLAA